MTPDDPTPKGALRALAAGARLDADRAAVLMEAVIDAELGELETAAFLGALAARGPDAQELAGFARVLEARMVALPDPLPDAIDTCGTGGSGQPKLNTSTLAGVVAAAAGARVAKHGNRSASGRCGSLDVLERLGVEVELSPDANRRILGERGLAFLNARTHHPVLGRLGPLRRTLGFRTVFNLLGPLLSPARVTRQLLGVSDATLAPILAEALARLGRERAWVVAGPEGLDEIGLEGETAVWVVEDGEVKPTSIQPRALALDRASTAAELRGGGVERNAQRFVDILSGRDLGPARDHVALNAAGALVVAGISPDIEAGVETATRALEGGAALALFERWRADTRAAAQAELGASPAPTPSARDRADSEARS